MGISFSMGYAKSLLMKEEEKKMNIFPFTAAIATASESLFIRGIVSLRIEDLLVSSGIPSASIYICQIES